MKTCLESVLKNKRQSCCRPKKTFVIPSVDATFSSKEEVFQGQLNTNDFNDNIYKNELNDSTVNADDDDRTRDVSAGDAEAASVTDDVVADVIAEVPQIN